MEMHSQYSIIVLSWDSIFCLQCLLELDLTLIIPSIGKFVIGNDGFTAAQSVSNTACNHSNLHIKNVMLPCFTQTETQNSSQRVENQSVLYEENKLWTSATVSEQHCLRLLFK